MLLPEANYSKVEAILLCALHKNTTSDLSVYLRNISSVFMLKFKQKNCKFQIF